MNPRKRFDFLPVVIGTCMVLGGLGLLAVSKAAFADRLGEAIPEGGCVLCWGGPDGGTQIGYSTSGKCSRGEADVVEPTPAGCQGPDLTAGHPVLEGLAVLPVLPMDVAEPVTVLPVLPSDAAEPVTVLPVIEGLAGLLVREARADVSGGHGHERQVVECPEGHYVSGIRMDEQGRLNAVCEPLPPQGGHSHSGILLDAVSGFLMREARADTGPVCGVHYSTRLEEAEKHFLDAGFQSIRWLRYMDLPAVIQMRATMGNRANCNSARVLVRQWDREGRCTSFYQGDSDLFGGECNVYGFRAAHYIGPPGNLGRDAP